MSRIWNPHHRFVPFCGTFRDFHKAVAEHWGTELKRNGVSTIYQFLLDFEKALFEHLTDVLREDLKIGASVHAIAYFSWEHREQIFQIRRVYPQSKDVSSYSVCYPEWGVLAATLEMLLGKCWPCCSYPVGCVSIREEGHAQHALPFLLEPTRQDFNQMIHFPVVRTPSARFTGRCGVGPELLGVFVAFIKRTQTCEQRPDEGCHCSWLQELRAFCRLRRDIRCFVESVGSVVKGQEESILKRHKNFSAGQTGDQLLAYLWRQQDGASFAEVCLKNVPSDLAVSYGAYVARETRGRFFVLVDGTTLLIAPRRAGKEEVCELKEEVCELKKEVCKLMKEVKEELHRKYKLCLEYESPQMSVGRGGASSMPPQHRNSIDVRAPAE